MPGMCSVPGCKGYKKARSRGVVFHSLPTRDPERCRKWLKAIHNPKFDVNTPVNKYGSIRVCSQHFKPEDYEPDVQAELMKTTPRKILKSNVVPSVFCGQQEELSRSEAAGDRSPAQAPGSAAQASTSMSTVDSVLRWASAITSGVRTQTSSSTTQSPGVDAQSSSPSLPIPISSGTTSNVLPPAELSESLCSVTSVDRLNESLHKETKLGSTATSKSDESRERNLTQSKTIVSDSCLMELFKKCQTCGHTITKKKVSHYGAQTKVRWSCLGGHKGVWMSSPYLWEAFPEIHLLTALSILFSGGAFTHFRKWAKHLHLNFMGHKTFLEVQKAHISQEMKQMNTTAPEEILTKETHQEPEGSLRHISDVLKKIKAKRRGRRTLSLPSSSEKGSSVLTSPTETSIQESSALSSVGHVSDHESEQHYQDEAKHQSNSTQTAHTASETTFSQDSFEEMEVTIDEDECDSIKTIKSETTDLTIARPDDSGDEDVYVPIIPQRSTASELLLECEEEELEPWQKQTSLCKVKVKDDVGGLECKPEPSPLQEDAANSSPPELKTESPQPAVFNNQSFFVASPQLPNSTNFIGSLGTQCLAGTSFAIVPAVQQQLFQRAAAATVTPEPSGAVHTPEMHQISNNSVSSSSVPSPVVLASSSSSQQQADQSKSRTLSVPFSLPCFTVLELQSTGSSKNNK